MQKRIEPMGALPYTLFGLALAVIGLVSLNHLSGLWLFDASQRIDLLRALATDQADSTMIMEAALPDMILAFLSVVLVIGTGIALPLVYFLNKRFRWGPLHYLIMLRQAMWFGLWVAFSVWLQMNRALGIAAMALVAIVLILVELLLQIRGRVATERDILKSV